MIKIAVGRFFLILTSILVSGTFSAAAKTPFLKTPDGKIQAYFNGESCAERVEMIFESKDPGAFAAASTPASRLMNNASSVLSRSCGKLQRITSKGVVGDRVLYTGIAERATDWKLTELGGRSEGLFSGSNAERGQRERFASSAGYRPVSDLKGELVDKNFCISPDAAGTCSGESAFKSASGNSLSVSARYLLDEEGSQAQLSYTSEPDANGFLCNETKAVKIGVTGGELTDEGRAEYADLLRERIESSGDSVCAGFRKSDGALEIGTFDDEGRSLGAPAPMVAAAGAVKLRLEE